MAAEVGRVNGTADLIRKTGRDGLRPYCEVDQTAQVFWVKASAVVL
jgi:hypothetical protein